MSISVENEINAVRLLQSAIFSEPDTLPQGYPDPGWCCTEHAVVASLAFRLCGITAFLCSGELLIGKTNHWSVPVRVVPHDYVVIGDPPKGVFDSSITCDSIDGIPMCYSEVYPMLGIGLTDRPITVDDWRMESSGVHKATFALYSVKGVVIPNEKMVKWESTTPFGKWLSQRYGSQNGLWGKAALLVAQHLLGQARLDYSKHDKTSFWDHIASAPDRDDEILGEFAERG